MLVDMALAMLIPVIIRNLLMIFDWHNFLAFFKGIWWAVWSVYNWCDQPGGVFESRIFRVLFTCVGLLTCGLCGGRGPLVEEAEEEVHTRVLAFVSDPLGANNGNDDEFADDEYDE